MQPIISSLVGRREPIRPTFTMVTCTGPTNWEVDCHLACKFNRLFLLLLIKVLNLYFSKCYNFSGQSSAMAKDTLMAFRRALCKDTCTLLCSLPVHGLYRPVVFKSFVKRTEENVLPFRISSASLSNQHCFDSFHLSTDPTISSK